MAAHWHPGNRRVLPDVSWLSPLRRANPMHSCSVLQVVIGVIVVADVGEPRGIQLQRVHCPTLPWLSTIPVADRIVHEEVRRSPLEPS